jgi:hypothetical protein
MIESLTTRAEIQAEKAEALPAFSGIKLIHIKRQLSELLSLIGRDGFFDEYTRHDISHIDEMLRILDWLIPESTQIVMTPADWLITVLAIYFHDLGLLVTKEEFANRYSSGFPEFRDSRLYGDKDGEDYRAKVEQLSPDLAERFLYQEFVRYKHAERIRSWIVGKASDHLGVTHRVMSEVDALLKPLDPQIRNDLALVCESHHLDDLYDLRRYKTSQPYGNSDAETANVQYAAVLLRSADLLHITRDRTPSIMFRTINPADPISQQEWAKQMAVRRVRFQLGRDRDGNFDEKAPRDTIEVHAYFTQEDGFFGLTSYLVYTKAQLLKCHDWIGTTRKKRIAPHEFPWRHIDDTNVETEGFLKQTFEFTIDQAKVLDLLTGHTLYNDTGVVLRELVQNSLDAIRLQKLINEQSDTGPEIGRVLIHWDSKRRILSVEDNGTGMTQAIIEKHLLKVGASLYQDSQFKKQYPTFSSISRFGIGVLSTFMIADTVEITTTHPDEEQARQLSLRSVHGKYLIRLIDKHTNPVIKRLTPHGTMIQLSVRPSADMGDVAAIVRKWIVIPGCEVSVSIDDKQPEKIGFGSPKEAVIEELKRHGVSVSGNVRVVEQELEDVTVAYAIIWSEYFREWSFFSIRSRRTAFDSWLLYSVNSNLELQIEPESIFLGTCIEGVRVEFATPGFKGKSIVAVANVRGPNAPKTNVARSGLEVTPELDTTLRAIYQIYLNHVSSEVDRMSTEKHSSVTWAAAEAKYLLNPLLQNTRNSDERPMNLDLLNERLNMLPALLVEQDGERKIASPAELINESQFWTLDGPFFRSAEWILREMPGRSSLSVLTTAFQAYEYEIPNEMVVCDFDVHGELENAVLSSKEVDTIKINRNLRRLDFRWTDKANPPRWYELPWPNNEEANRLVRAYIEGEGRNVRPNLQVTIRRILEGRYSARHGSFWPDIRIGRHGITIDGQIDEVAVRSLGATFLLPDTDLARFLIDWIGKIEQIRSQEVVLMTFAIFGVIGILLDHYTADAEKSRLTDELIELMGTVKLPDLAQLSTLIRNTKWKMFYPSAWTRMSG